MITRRLDPYETIIHEGKLRDYILSSTHAVGRFKATFFHSLGYASEGWQALAEDLRRQHLALDAELVEANAFGRKYRIVAQLSGPAGRSALVVSIWIVRTGEDAARLVTLYPEAI
jgi:hypothetical protein